MQLGDVPLVERCQDSVDDGEEGVIYPPGEGKGAARVTTAPLSCEADWVTGT